MPQAIGPYLAHDERSELQSASDRLLVVVSKTDAWTLQADQVLLESSNWKLGVVVLLVAEVSEGIR